MFIDFMGVCFDQIFNQAAKFRYMFGGKAVTPVVIRTMWGAGLRAAAQHSQSLLPVFTHIPGLKVAAPSNPYDAKGLLIQSIRDDDPVIFAEHKMLYDTSGDVPEESYTIPFGEANIVREGGDVTIVAIGRMVNTALEAADGAGLVRHRGRDHRPAHHQPAGPGHHPGVGGEHRAAGRGGRVQPALLAGLRHRGVGGAGGVRRRCGRRSSWSPGRTRRSRSPTRWRTCSSRTRPRSPARSRRPPTGRSDPIMTDDRIQTGHDAEMGPVDEDGQDRRVVRGRGRHDHQGRRPGRHRDRQDRRHAGVAGGGAAAPDRRRARGRPADRRRAGGAGPGRGARLRHRGGGRGGASAAVESGELEGGDEPTPQLVEVGGRTISYLTLARRRGARAGGLRWCWCTASAGTRTPGCSCSSRCPRRTPCTRSTCPGTARRARTSATGR